METYGVTFSPDDDHALRRVRSMGDMPDTEPGSSRPSRTYIPLGHSPRRSEGQPHPPFPPISPLLSPPPRVAFRDRPERPTNTYRTTDLFIEERLPPLEIPPPPTPRRQASANDTPRRPPPERRGALGAVLTFFGYQGRDAQARKEVVGLIWGLSTAIVQVCQVCFL